jgi:hypothetical protein
MELLLGAALGGVVSWIISETYHRRSSRHLRAEISTLREQDADMRETLTGLEWAVDRIERDSKKALGYAVRGTPDDPDWPYK